MLIYKEAYWKIFGLLFIVFLAKGEELHSDPPSEAFPRENYAAVFKNIPRLFGHVIDLLEEQPEILERNDVRVKRADDKRAGDEIADDERAVDDRAGDEKVGCQEKRDQGLLDYVRSVLNFG